MVDTNGCSIDSPLVGLRTDGLSDIHVFKQRSVEPLCGSMGARANTDWPFRDLKAREIRDAGRKAFERRDVVQLREAISELDTFRSTGEARQVSEELSELLDRLEPQSEERCEGEAQICRACGESSHCGGIFYCGTCLPVLLQRIERDVTHITAASAVKPYVGRTAFPERRLLQHLCKKGRDRLSILHWADSLEEAEAFEPLFQVNAAGPSRRRPFGWSI